MNYIVDPIQVVQPVETTWSLEGNGPDELNPLNAMYIDTPSNHQGPCSGPFDCHAMPNF